MFLVYKKAPFIPYQKVRNKRGFWFNIILILVPISGTTLFAAVISDNSLGDFFVYLDSL
jgi:hypothetical protein